jgi:hypothetical protein
MNCLKCTHCIYTKADEPHCDIFFMRDIQTKSWADICEGWKEHPILSVVPELPKMENPRWRPE